MLACAIRENLEERAFVHVFGTEMFEQTFLVLFLLKQFFFEVAGEEFFHEHLVPSLGVWRVGPVSPSNFFFLFLLLLFLLASEFLFLQNPLFQVLILTHNLYEEFGCEMSSLAGGRGFGLEKLLKQIVNELGRERFGKALPQEAIDKTFCIFALVFRYLSL